MNSPGRHSALVIPGGQKRDVPGSTITSRSGDFFPYDPIADDVAGGIAVELTSLFVGLVFAQMKVY